MTILIALFAISLLGMVLLVTRKLMLLRTGEIRAKIEEVSNPLFPDWQKVSEVAKKNIRQYGYSAVVAAIRMYVRSANFTKEKSKEITRKLVNLINKNKNNNARDTEPQKVNKFLKMVAEYKQKLRNIKHRVSEEEKNL